MCGLGSDGVTLRTCFVAWRSTVTPGIVPQAGHYLSDYLRIILSGELLIRFMYVQAGASVFIVNI